jgi:predicted AAA+ superfamily ATPase
MVHIERSLDLDLPKGQSAFLWGPRQTGKSTYLRARFPDSIWFDLLQTDRFLDLSRRPSILREEILAKDDEARGKPIVIDEIQKVPALLDEVHWLMENHGLRFVLSGSSARQLKRGRANLLGGRAWRFQLFPLTSREVGAVRDTGDRGPLDLLRILNRGMLPRPYLQGHHRRSLRAYTRDYLKEEVFDEGLTRNVPAFSRFFESMAYSHGEMTNFANIARDTGVDGKTVKEYYQILVDTLLGTWVPPYKRRQRRQVIGKAAKFYLFDVGVAGSIQGRTITQERGPEFGKALEHFILMEIRAHASYKELHYPVHYWRTKSGLEVDFILGDGQTAIEVKGSSRVDRKDVRGLEVFAAEQSPNQAIVIANETRPRTMGDLLVLPIREFLERLWTGAIMA